MSLDRFSFLNAAHTAFFADLYDQYIENPDSVEPSWRSFFQGFDFGSSEYGYETLDVPREAASVAAQPVSDYSGIPEKLQ